MTSRPRRAYSTERGEAYWSTVEDFLESPLADEVRGEVQLVLTSPPFPLHKKKAYGNLNGDSFRDWLTETMTRIADLIKPTGSLVIELGNAWESGQPEMSTLPLETLLALKSQANLALCQQFIVHNPARLPSPVQWVNIERSRVKDSFTHVWWLSPTAHPEADNRRVLTEYSSSMKKLLERQSYNDGLRPSGHNIGNASFLSDNGGAIPSNVLEASNTRSSGSYPKTCQRLGVPVHPARMQPEVADFFIKFLSSPGDLVLDPFAGSNTTGEAAERHNRRWIAIDAELDYLRGSTGRFEDARWWLRTHPLQVAERP
ncbi:MAG: site-specific DNA-methyltransferase [Candidatus Paceibacterota bacterium]